MRSSILFSVAELSQPKMSDRARAADNESLPGGVNNSSYRAGIAVLGLVAGLSGTCSYPPSVSL